MNLTSPEIQQSQNYFPECNKQRIIIAHLDSYLFNTCWTKRMVRYMNGGGVFSCMQCKIDTKSLYEPS